MKSNSQVMQLWAEKTAYTEMKTRQALLADLSVEESHHDRVVFVRRSQCRTTHKRKDC